METINAVVFEQKCLSGNYLIGKEIGRGGMATVYSAFDQQNQKLVAIKHLRIPSHFIEHERDQAIQRFLNEGKLMQFLDHPNIIKAYDAFTYENEYFIVMEHLNGVTIKELLSHFKPTQVNLIHLFEQLASAIGYAHSRNIVHRDIKPENIMIVRQEGLLKVKLLDFGIARLENDQRITIDGSLLGSVAYMSPEQLQNSHNINHQTDIYSLGVVMYELLTGRLPVPSDSVALAIMHIFSKDPVPAMEINREIGPDLNQIVMTCFNKYREYRFASADLLGRLLQNLREAYQQLTEVPNAESQMLTPRIYNFDKHRFVDVFEALGQREFTGCCVVWNAFQESTLFFKAGQFCFIETPSHKVVTFDDTFDALSDVICWEAGKFYCFTKFVDKENALSLDMDSLAMALKEILKEFIALWIDYRDFDFPELLLKPSASDKFSEVVKYIVDAVEKKIYIGQLYTLLPFSRIEVLTGIKELHDRQYLFVERESYPVLQ